MSPLSTYDTPWSPSQQHKKRGPKGNLVFAMYLRHDILHWAAALSFISRAGFSGGVWTSSTG